MATQIGFIMLFANIVYSEDAMLSPSTIRDQRSPEADPEAQFHHGPPRHHAPLHHAPLHHAPAPYAPPIHHAPAPYAPPVHHAPAYKEPARPYQYEYGVADQYSGAQFAETQTQDAAGVVQGSYSVALPDGRTQTVNYHADHHGGYVAEVTYEGTAVYPDHHPAPYHAPAPHHAPAPYHAPAPPVYKPAPPPVYKPAPPPVYHPPPPLHH